ncbi:TadE family type IV pilus minor pilin [Zafaria sp. Z1313]|uniref:TadE family type IV pilus minor pilin n=1 Tax=unclassified Zafaria TaxID=2828765 RepID=UPI002E78B1BA|nr:TadE family type IV pilus minor pilin [Zafaria sp. J156]MEE1621347.1 TadE family type IV pilus minor pilin [Zafaria sp. J156]
MFRGSERGSSTAETAVLLPAVALLLVVVLAAGAVGSTQVRLEEAARAAARELARGEPAGSARAAAQRVAGTSASVDIGAAAGYHSVSVSAGIGVPGLEGRFVLTARAEARAEGGPGG